MAPKNKHKNKDKIIRIQANDPESIKILMSKEKPNPDNHTKKFPLMTIRKINGQIYPSDKGAFAVINKLLDSNVKNAHQIFNELVEVIYAFNVKIIVKDNFSVVAVQNTDSRLELLAMVKRIADDEDVNIKIVQNDKFTLVKIKDDTTEKRKQFWTSMYEFAKEYQLQHIPLDIAIVNGADPLYETDMDKELKRLYDLIF